MTHLQTNKNPQPSALREQIHGRLQPMAREPSLLGGTLMLVAGFVVGALLIAAFS